MNKTAEMKFCDGEKKEYTSPSMNIVQLSATSVLLADSCVGDSCDDDLPLEVEP